MKLQRWVLFLLIMLLEYYQAKRCAQIQFMKLQIEFLWDRLDQNRVVLTRSGCGCFGLEQRWIMT